MKSIGRFPIVQTLVRGKNAAIHVGIDPSTGRKVAIKTLGAVKPTPRQRRRFRREAGALARLRHPNVVRLLEAGEHEGAQYLALEYHREGSLADALAESGPTDPRFATVLGLGICAGLAAAHARGILHRDLKPGNVLIGDCGNPRLTDFGLARALDRDLESQKLTLAGSLLGTPGYWAPEQVSGDLSACGPWTDIYGAGATLYATLTGRPPIEKDGLIETLLATATEAPTPIRDLNPAVPEALEAIVMRCLAKRPEDRWPSADALREALLRYRREPTALTSGAVRVPRRAHLAAAAALLVAVGVGIGAALAAVSAAVVGDPPAEHPARLAVR